MSVFEQMRAYGHEQVVFCSEPAVGLRAIIAIHDTTLGPALGGVRMWNYRTEEEALQDVLRLSRAMTYKAALAGLRLGGGKAVILGDPRTEKSEGLFRAFGRFVESLGGRYITAEDVGTTVEDMEWIRQETRYVTGVAGKSGDPSPVTAYGVYCGMKACAQVVYGEDSLAGRTIAVQGAGNVARHLVAHLVREGAAVYVADIFPEKVQRLREELGNAITAVDPRLSTTWSAISSRRMRSVAPSTNAPFRACAAASLPGVRTISSRMNAPMHFACTSAASCMRPTTSSMPVGSSTLLPNWRASTTGSAYSGALRGSTPRCCGCSSWRRSGINRPRRRLPNLPTGYCVDEHGIATDAQAAEGGR
jgi:hypothetical protein